MEGEDSEARSLQSHLRKQCYPRQTDYIHPELVFRHQPINAKECEQLHRQLQAMVTPRLETVKQRHDLTSLSAEYDTAYDEFASMTNQNEAQHSHISRNIKQMHEMADMLLHPPEMGQNLFLYQRERGSRQQEEEISRIFQEYERAYETGERVEDDAAQLVIKKAKQLILGKRI